MTFVPVYNLLLIQAERDHLNIWWYCLFPPEWAIFEIDVPMEVL